MEQYIKEHIKLTEKVLADEKDTNKLKDYLIYNRVQIKFLQHERLIHLLVTFFFALMFLIILIGNFVYPNIYFFVINILLLVMLIFYIRHYYILENGIQRLYKLDQEIVKICQK